MKRSYLGILITLISLAITIGCKKHLTYQEILDVELAKDDRYDSLFYGIHFNMTTPAFLDHCFEMNQQKIFYQYGVGSEVIIKFEKGFKYPVDFVFFPNLEKHLIQELKGRFSYYGSNPFQKDRGSHVLIADLVRQMEKWYGGRKFIKMAASEKWLPEIYIKIDGNRKITLEENIITGEVNVLYEDLKRIL